MVPTLSESIRNAEIAIIRYQGDNDKWVKASIPRTARRAGYGNWKRLSDQRVWKQVYRHIFQ